MHFSIVGQGTQGAVNDLGPVMKSPKDSIQRRRRRPITAGHVLPGFVLISAGPSTYVYSYPPCR